MTNLELEEKVAELEAKISIIYRMLETQRKINDLVSDNMSDLMAKMIGISKATADNSVGIVALSTMIEKEP